MQMNEGMAIASFEDAVMWTQGGTYEGKIVLFPFLAIVRGIQHEVDHPVEAAIPLEQIISIVQKVEIPAEDTPEAAGPEPVESK